MVDSYTRRAKEIRVIDGDTIEVTLDFGYHFGWDKVEIRFLGINAPEKHGATKEEGLAAKAHLEEILSRGSVHVHTPNYDKRTFARYLSNVYVVDDKTKEEIFVNQKMIDDGFAVPFMV